MDRNETWSAGNFTGDNNVTFAVFVNPFNNLPIRVFFITCYTVVCAMCVFETIGVTNSLAPEEMPIIDVSSGSKLFAHWLMISPLVPKELKSKRVAGNAMVLLAIARSPRLRGMTNFFLANLAVADFCVGVFCILPNLSTFLSQNWILGKIMCKIYYYVWNVSYTASIVILTVIAIERYIAIIHPLRARHYLTKRKLRLVQAAIWGLALLYNVPYLFFFTTVSPEGVDEEYCYLYGDNIDNMKGLSLANAIVWYVFPLISIAFMYYRVAAALWRTTVVAALRLRKYPQNSDVDASRINSVTQATYTDRKKIVTFNVTAELNRDDGDQHRQSGEEDRSYSSGSSGSYCSDPLSTSKERNGIICEYAVNNRNREDTTCFIQPSVCDVNVGRRPLEVTSSNGSNSSRTSLRYQQTHLSGSRRVARARRKVIRLLIAVVISFAVCVFPHQVRVLNHYWGFVAMPQPVGLIFSPVSFILLYLNSVLNPILYALFSNHFRRSFKESFSCFRKQTKLTTR